MMTACMAMGEACAAECDDARGDVRALPDLRLGVPRDGRGVPVGDVLDADGLAERCQPADTGAPRTRRLRERRPRRRGAPRRAPRSRAPPWWPGRSRRRRAGRR